MDDLVLSGVSREELRDAFQQWREEHPYLTVKQAAASLKLSPSLVYALCRDGVIRCTRHGRLGRRGTIRIAADAIEEYRRSCLQKPVLNSTLPLQHIKG